MSFALAFALLASLGAAAPAIDLGYRMPPSAQPTGRAIPDGRAATLTYQRGSVTVRPLQQATTRNRQCLVELTSARGRVERVTTIGTGETEALTCGRLRAFGRLPGPPGTDRIGLIYQAYSPNATVETLVILARTATAPRWHPDDRLADRLGQRDELTTLPAMRRYLLRRGL